MSSRTPRIITMRRHRHSMYVRKDGVAKCTNCPTVIDIGDSYVPRPSGAGGNKTSIYCVSCAEVLNIV